jgi:hypothetical protein
VRLEYRANVNISCKILFSAAQKFSVLILDSLQNFQATPIAAGAWILISSSDRLIVQVLLVSNTLYDLFFSMFEKICLTRNSAMMIC